MLYFNNHAYKIIKELSCTESLKSVTKSTLIAHLDPNAKFSLGILALHLDFIECMAADRFTC